MKAFGKYLFSKKLHIVLLAVLLICAVNTGTTLGKYIHSRNITGKVVFTTQLAENIVLQEHEASRGEDGSYTLTEDVVTENTYLAMPGVDIPKDPHVVITSKSAVDAYLYVEVVEKAGSGTVEAGVVPGTITYSLTKDWMELSGAAPKYGGAVYVYTGGGTTPQKLNETLNQASGELDVRIPILQNDTIYVSEQMDAFTEFSLEFYGAMTQSEGAGTADGDAVAAAVAAYAR